MASTALGDQLTEGQRVAQIRIGQATVRRLAGTWPLLDPSDLAGSTGRWLDVAVPVVETQRRLSADVAGEYMRRFRASEGVAGDLTVVGAPMNAEQVRTSLTVTGPVGVRQRLRRGMPMGDTLERAMTQTMGAALRHSLNGGRETLQKSIEADGWAVGWARVTADDACYFCAMLASRGAVYRHDSFDVPTRAGRTASDPRFTGGGDAKVHDSCRCTLEPVYYGSAPLPPSTKRWESLWADVNPQGRDAVKQWRREFDFLTGAVDRPVMPRS